MRTGLIAAYVFQKDFKLKTKTDLYWDLKVVHDSGGDDFIKGDIQDDIARIMFADDPDEHMKYLVGKDLYPFSGKSKEQIAMLMSSNYIPENVKVLWANFGWIIDEIAREESKKGNNFYLMDKTKRMKLVDKKVTKIMDTLKTDIKINPELLDNP